VTRRQHVKTLERRLNFLRGRAGIAAARPGWRGLDFDKGEIASLEFALAVMEDAEAIGLPKLGKLTVEERQQLRAFLEGREAAA
jgi:hypothetical protein